MNTQLSVWSSYYYHLSPEDAVLEFKKHGIMASELSDEHGELLLSRGEPKVVGRQFRAFLEKEGFTMTQGHLWLRIKLCSSEDALPKLLDWIDMYDSIGIRNAVLHVDYIVDEPDLTRAERIARNVEKLKLVEAHIKENNLGICICLENLRMMTPGIDELDAILNQLDPDCFGICLDTGHLNIAENKNQREFILKAGKRLKALHIADNEGQTDQHMMPFGRGHVDFEEVVAALREVDYQGLFNLEIPGESHCPHPVLGYKLEYIRKYYDYLMSE